MGWTGYQMGPPIFFLLCPYIDKVYINLYRFAIKIVTNILVVSKFDVKLESYDLIFKMPMEK